jgi:adenylate cyclase
MCAGGIPSANTTHAVDAVEAGLAIQEYIAWKNAKRKEDGLPPWELRIGIHTGPIVAGVVGSKKYAYDIWGDAVNIASRMESNGEAGKVNISEATYDLVKERFKCVARGKISVKGAGDKHMYFVEGPISSATQEVVSDDITAN